MNENSSPNDLDLEAIALDVWLDFLTLSRAHENDDAAFERLCERRPGLAPELRKLKSRRSEACSQVVTSEKDGRSRFEERLGELAAPILRGERFRREALIARGGMGVVHRVWDLELKRMLALKEMVLEPSQQSHVAAARFLEEAQVAAQLDHPGIVPVHEVGLDARGRLYFAMKLVLGRDLRAILDLVREGAEGWTQTRALGVLLKVCEAMAYAHSKGVIHRDLKPGNVMVGHFGEVYVMDWGLARVMGRQDVHDIRLRLGDESPSVRTERREEREGTPDSPLVTMDGVVIGTPAYMPPEQARGEVHLLSPRSDVYSIGAMLYHLLTGQVPFVPPGARLSKNAVLFRVMEGPPLPIHELNPGVAAELAAICERAMARAPGDRYQDTLALGDDLRAYLEGRVVRAYETGAVAELRKWVWRNKGLAAASAAAVLLLVAGLAASLVFKARSDYHARMAQGNEQRALDGESLAKEEALRAEKKTDEVLRLSALQKLEDLVAEAERDWPAHPRKVAKYTDWLKRAQELVDELPQHEAKLAELRGNAIPWSEEEQAVQRATHPRLDEFGRLQRQLAFLRTPPAEEASADALGIDWDALPKDASGLGKLARPLVSPDRKDWGGEAKGLVLARKAVELASSLSAPERAAVRDTLAWALFAAGRLDEAAAEEAKALEEAGEGRRIEFEGNAAKLQKAIQDRVSPEGLQKRAQQAAELEREIGELQAQLLVRLEWSFYSSEDKWWHNQLVKLVDGLKAFADPEEGLFSGGVSPEHGWGVRKRLDFARTVEESTIRGQGIAETWAGTIASIRDEARCPKYAGLEITPQLGLLPIGQDPASGLWEFAHLQTGEPAERLDGRLVLREETGLVFVLIPGGTFWMGAQDQDPLARNYDPRADADEYPVHEIELAPFFLSKYEMTQGQWERFLKNPSAYGPTWAFGKQHDLKHPVEQVSWEDCARVLGRLDLVLPTEAQWEYAARAGTSTAWWTGDEVRSLEGAGNVADAFAKANRGPTGWVYEESLNDGYTVHAPIASYRANPFGLHDVIGNVWEWCRDGHATYRVGVRPCDGERMVEKDLAFSVLRGGGFSEPAAPARSAFRSRWPPGYRRIEVGVRPARTITP